ncbi:Retrovirus-related Pol polyprotein from type-2 retrotransposable element R2DM [Stylophora pistillata]|uniref:Retrovirus-related Pol polyprotein from type-2 retrotransposable element R2DM n=1 Tax=Stylophora pistillata TaxID=50429 RepID=A0A2B4S9N4_STYPI|nr:Retrovirus-related Pol polyprotein from type-2 retrotransposable element R2DM [Stylophora pistillata]
MVKALYADFECGVVDGQDTTEWFKIKTGVKQGCNMSGLLFTVVVDWVMRNASKEGNTGIRLKFTTKLEDLDFADDIALLSSTGQHIQTKTDKLAHEAERVGLKVNVDKCKLLRLNSRSNDVVEVYRRGIEDTDRFVYLGATVPKRVEALKKYRTDGCLRRIFKIRWQERITNKEVLKMAEMENLSEDVRRRRWKFIGHIMRKEPNNDCRTALTWTPKTTWRKTAEREGEKAGWKNWSETTWRKTAEREGEKAGWKNWSEFYICAMVILCLWCAFGELEHKYHDKVEKTLDKDFLAELGSEGTTKGIDKLQRKASYSWEFDSAVLPGGKVLWLVQHRLIYIKVWRLWSDCSRLWSQKRLSFCV